jgi:Ca2+-binding EF-hand superfamily protein
MKTYLMTLAFCLSAGAAMAQLAPQPAAEAPAAEDPNAPPPRAGGRMHGPLGLLAPPPNAMFQAIDVDEDGEISKIELSRAVRQLRKLDTDKDGKLTLAEVSSPGGPGGPPGQGGPFGDVAATIEKVMELDKNADGMLTADELPPQMAQQMMPLFQTGDKDGDGALSRAELRAAMEVMKNQLGNGPPGWPVGPPGLAGGPGAPAGRDADPQHLVGLMLKYDQDGDGQLSPKEVPKQQIGFLRKGDLNGDGFIDAAELRPIIERDGARIRASLARSAGKNKPARAGAGDADAPSDKDELDRRGER